MKRYTTHDPDRAQQPESLRKLNVGYAWLLKENRQQLTQKNNANIFLHFPEKAHLPKMNSFRAPARVPTGPLTNQKRKSRVVRTREVGSPHRPSESTFSPEEVHCLRRGCTCVAAPQHIMTDVLILCCELLLCTGKSKVSVHLLHP